MMKTASHLSPRNQAEHNGTPCYQLCMMGKEQRAVCRRADPLLHIRGIRVNNLRQQIAFSDKIRRMMVTDQDPSSFIVDVHKLFFFYCLVFDPSGNSPPSMPFSVRNRSTLSGLL